ncbi:MAG TPA: hypothetical protein VLJ62_32155 [Burkholderiaceae bacterium]|nr:hypothetical protein [Burkholderiaceae bacterium]
MPSWRLVAAGLALAGYALLSHVLMVLAGDKPWAVAALLGPLVLAVAGVAWQHRHLPTLLVCIAALGWLAWIGASGQAQSINRLYLLQHAGIHLALGCAFAYTLRPRATPLITALAARTHGTVTAVKALYTRRVTALWAGYFGVMVVLSLALYAWAPWWVWSLFANLATPVAAIGLFVGEHWLRYRLHPEFERATMLQALRAYRETPIAEAHRP